MNVRSRIALFGAFTFILASCGGDPIDETGGGTVGGPVDPVVDPVVDVPVGVAQDGAAVFASMCVGCHMVTDSNMTAGYTYDSLAVFIEDGMPLNDASRCDLMCAANVTAYIEQENDGFNIDETPNTSDDGLGNVRVPSGSIDPAPTIIRRLNRQEYNNTLSDLLQTEISLAEDFPVDSFSFGFDKIASIQTVTPFHTEQYMRAAGALADGVLNRPLTANGTQVYEAEDYTAEGSSSPRDGALNLGAKGSRLPITINVPSAGTYTLTIRAAQDYGGGEDAVMSVIINNNKQHDVTVASRDPVRQDKTLQVNFNAGNNQLVLAFANPYYEAGVGDRNLIVDRVTLHGTDSGESVVILPCSYSGGVTCARTMAKDFGAKAWRRPLTGTEENNLVSVFEAAKEIGLDNKESMSAMLQALFLSPNFMYITELDSDPNSSEPKSLNAYELASRLSYFLWSSMPDEALFDAAKDGSLLNTSELAAQVKRMLSDPKSASLIDDFAANWLNFKAVLNADPDSILFPNFDKALAQSMAEESRLYVKEWFDTNGTLAELLTGQYTYLDNRLAAHYGENVSGDGFTRFEWPEKNRAGILSLGAILTSTSFPDRTAPVIRGEYVLSKLLCKEPPPPPPGVENLSEEALVEGLTTRERFEKHRDASTVCYSCHILMDPIGFGFENFDAVGRYRTAEGDLQVDASGELPGGQAFEGNIELSGILANTPELPLCATRALATYALGREVHALHSNDPEEGSDDPLVYQIYKQTEGSGHRIHDLIEKIVLSSAFRQRRGADSGKGDL